MSSNEINTFVFYDIETTGLPDYEFNKTKITELTMVAVQRDHLLDCKHKTLPRVIQKLTLCMNPRRIITSTEITGLANDMLEHQKVFDVNTVTIIELFLSRLPEPVCLVAHNGNKFDYPILQKEIQKLGQKLSENILCIDSLVVFKELHDLNLMPDHIEDTNSLDIKPLEPQDYSMKKKINEDTQEKCQNDEEQRISEIETTDELDHSKIFDSVFNDFKQELNDYVPDAMRSNNETTPKRATSSTYIENNLKSKRDRKNEHIDLSCTNAKKRLFMPKTSFKLVDIYKRIYKEDAKDAHNAEGDVMTLLYIAAACGDNFYKWCDEHSIPFNLVKSI